MAATEEIAIARLGVEDAAAGLVLSTEAPVETVADGAAALVDGAEPAAMVLSVMCP